MRTAAPDFRLFWDNAYAVHHLTEERIEIAKSSMRARATAPKPRVRVRLHLEDHARRRGRGPLRGLGGERGLVLGCIGLRTIGPDKLNQLRHVRFLSNKDGEASA